ncbi:MAG: nuclear transport factor 2 family protein [Gemmatimonadales bacterium]
MTTEEVLNHHLGAFGAGDTDEIMKDFTEASVMHTPEGVLRGLAKIRPVFEKFFSEITPPGETEFEMLQMSVVDNVAYIVWKASSKFADIPVGTDTFVVRDDKIVAQSFAAHVIPKE